MTVSAEQLARVIYHQVHYNPKELSSFMKKFYSFMERYNITALLPHVARHLRRMKRDQDAHNAYEIISAEKLSGTSMHRVLKKINAPEGVHVIKKVQSELIGGIIIKHEGRMYDASIKTQLDNLRRLLTQ